MNTFDDGYYYFKNDTVERLLFIQYIKGKGYRIKEKLLKYYGIDQHDSTFSEHGLYHALIGVERYITKITEAEAFILSI